MATDRLTCSSQARVQDNPPAHASRMFSNARYVLNLGTSSVMERAKRAELLAITAFSADYQSAVLAHVAIV